jgi:hypothetical protein
MDRKPRDRIDGRSRLRCAAHNLADVNERDDWHIFELVLERIQDGPHRHVDCHLSPALPDERGMYQVRSVEEVVRQIPSAGGCSTTKKHFRRGTFAADDQAFHRKAPILPQH